MTNQELRKMLANYPDDMTVEYIDSHMGYTPIQFLEAIPHIGPDGAEIYSIILPDE